MRERRRLFRLNPGMRHDVEHMRPMHDGEHECVCRGGARGRRRDSRLRGGRGRRW
jgi:hypothetical protein